MTERLGRFRYEGEAGLLEKGEEYVVFYTENGIECYKDGEQKPEMMEKANFLQTLDRTMVEVNSRGIVQ